jgi:hypothetical protein
MYLPLYKFENLDKVWSLGSINHSKITWKLQTRFTAGVKCYVAAVKCFPVLHFSVVIFFWSFGIFDANTIKCWELSTSQDGARGACGMLHIFIIPHVQTESNRVCNFNVILLRLMLPRDHFVSRFLTDSLYY